jgi:hypothetical protein
MEMKQILERAEIRFWNVFITIIDDSVFLQRSVNKVVRFMDNEKVNSFLAQVMVACVISLIVGFFWAVIFGLG